MTISFEIPRDIERQLDGRLDELTSRAREALLVELFREREISHHQLGKALNLGRYEVDGVLKRYGVGIDVSSEEILGDRGLLSDLRPS